MSTETVLTRRAGAVVVLVALALRVWHLVDFSALVFYDTPFGDARAYVDAAADIARRGPWGGVEPYFQGPLYPLALSVLAVLGLPPHLMLWAQAAIGAATALGVSAISAPLFGRRAALASGLLYAAYDMAVFFDGDLLGASIGTACGVWGLVGVMRISGGAARTSAGVLAGVGLAMAIWARPNLALPAVLLAGALVWRARRRILAGESFRPAALRAMLVILAAGFALPVIRNAVMTGEPVFTTGAGVNAYIGSHSGATGTFRLPPESGLSNDLALADLSRRVASGETGRELSAGEAARWWMSRAMREGFSSPAHAGTLLGRKLLWLVNREDVSNHLDIARIREASTPMRITPVRTWLLLAAASAGIVFAWGRAGTGLLLTYLAGGALSLLPFFITARYRLPLMPVAAVFAGALLAGGLVSGTTLRRRLVAIGVAGAAIALAWIPLGSGQNRAAGYVNEGALLLERGDVAGASEAFQRALALDPADPRARLNLATLALETGDPATAVASIEEALRREPQNPRAWNSYGIALAELERFDDALSAFERAGSLLPGWDEPPRNTEITWGRYRRHCARLVESAGLAPTDEGGAAAVVAFLEERGFRRAADDFRARWRAP